MDYARNQTASLGQTGGTDQGMDAMLESHGTRGHTGGKTKNHLNRVLDHYHRMLKSVEGDKVLMPV